MSSDDEIRQILLNYKTVAIVGISRDPHKDSRRVAAYLKGSNYRIVPINPSATSIMGMQAYPTLNDVPDHLAKEIEIVDVFRKSDAVPAIVEDAIKLKKRFGKLKVLWMQLGIVNLDAATSASNAGLTVVMDRCMAQEHNRMIRGKAHSDAR